MTYPSDVAEHEIFSAMDCLLNECCSKVVIIGGPGEGKSTLGQQLAQVHRAKLLGKPYDCKPYNFQPRIQRIPFRVVLKYFAQWLADNPNLDDLETYLAERVGNLAARPGTVSPQDIQEILRCRPCLLILDGLDEVVATDLQERMLARIQDFINRAEQLNANLMLVATSRPKEYKEKYEKHFAPEEFWHLELHRLSPEKVIEYSGKWIPAKILREEEQKRVLNTLEECRQDGSISALLTTPLQVTIILLIIKDGGNPPSQREALFSEYWSTIFRREKSKAKGVIQSDESTLFNLHGYLGYLLHRRAAEKNVQSLLPEEDFKQAVREFLRKEDRRSPDDAINSRMEQLFSGRDRLVLIVEPQQGLFGFELRSFQEFFAAVHLAQTATDTQQRFERLKAIACSEHWRNVALLFAGRIVRNFRGEASNILELVCRSVNRGEPNRYLRPGCWLALEIAADGAFSANRNLQYNAVEYGLEVLETGLTEEQQQELSSLTERLSEEDQRDILRPVLEEKLRSLPVGCLEVALDLYGQHFGSTPLFLEKIDTLLQTRQENIVFSALNLALRYESEPLWMVERLQVHWDYWKKNLQKVWQPQHEYEVWFCARKYAERLLKIWQLSQTQAKELAEVTFESPWSYYSLHSDQEPVWDMPEPKTLSDQLILMLRCVHWIAYWKRESRRHKKAKLSEWNAVSLTAMDMEINLFEPQPILSVPNNIAETLEALLQRTDLMPLLQVHLWKLFWLINEPNRANVSAFLKRIWSIQQSTALSEKLWYYNRLDKPWPLLTIAVKRQKIEGREAADRLLPFLEASTQLSIAQQVVKAVRESFEQSDETQQNQLFIAIKAQIGLDELLPKLVPLANQIGINVEELVNAHITGYIFHSGFRQFECTINQLQKLLTAAKEAIKQGDKPGRLLWCLFQSKWLTEPKVLRQARELLELILDRCSSSSESLPANLSVTLFLKLLAYDNQTQQIAPRLFATLSQNEILELSFWSIDEVIGEFFSECLLVMESFLKHENETVRVGSALILKAILGVPVRYREARKEEFQELSSIRFDAECGWSFVNFDDSKRRLVGIALLTLSDYPVGDINYQRRLLEALQQRQTTEEEEAWAELLKKIPMSQEKHTAWRNLLEEILDKPWSYSNSVLSAAMERYQTLGSPVSVTISKAEEKALGLL